MEKEMRCLGKMTVALAGRQPCADQAVAGENVCFIREPGDAHDPNTIVVKNAQNSLMGRLPPDICALLAPFLNAGKLRLAGKVLGHGNNGLESPSVFPAGTSQKDTPRETRLLLILLEPAENLM